MKLIGLNDFNYNSVLELSNVFTAESKVTKFAYKILDEAEKIFNNSNKKFSPIFYNHHYDLYNADLAFVLHCFYEFLKDEKLEEEKIVAIQNLFSRSNNFSSDNGLFFVSLLAHLNITVHPKGAQYYSKALYKNSNFIDSYFSYDSIMLDIVGFDARVTREYRMNVLDKMTNRKCGIELASYGLKQTAAKIRELKAEGISNIGNLGMYL